MYTAAPSAVFRFWRGLAAWMRTQGLDEVPEHLQAPTEDLYPHWLDSRLLLSQTCGYPYATTLRARGVQLVGAVRYAAEGCDGIRYRSHLVCREGDGARTLGDFRGRAAACNGTDSQSGYHALRAAVSLLPGSISPTDRFFARTTVSGSHARSLDWVRNGQADIAAIDCVSFAGFARHEPQRCQGLRILASTPDAPGLPLITSTSTSPAELQALRRALHQAMADPVLAAERDDLLIAGFDDSLSACTYDAILDMERQARTRGVSTL